MKLFVAAALAATIGLAGQALADGVALVIGNGDYANAPEAETAVRDANAVAEALEEAGWTVVLGTDLDRAGMRRAIVKFAAAQRNADASLIFYSGHALRAGGRSLAAPVKARAENLVQVEFDSVPMDLFLALAARTPGRSVVFIDGAQLRGFQPKDFVEPGIADIDAPDGVLVVSAAAPGQAVRRSAWRESRFARIIIDRFLNPGQSAMERATRAPAPVWHTGSVQSDFALVEAEDLAGDADALDAEIELAYWRAAERTGKAEDYRAYLSRYPRGRFAAAARQRLGIAVGGTAPNVPEVDPAVAAETALNLSRIRKRQIQEWLDVVGFDPRGIDGIFGPGTRRAIKLWQRSVGVDQTGYLNADQLALLRREGAIALVERRRREEEARRIAEAEDNAFWQATGANGRPDALRAYLDRYPEGLHAVAARAALAAIAEAEADELARRERRVWRRIEGRNTAEAYRDYLARFPQGIYRDEALARLDEIEQAEREEAQLAAWRQTERALNLSQQDMQSVEARLRALGFAPGRVDGRFNQRTRDAIKGYQSARGLGQTGFLNQRTVIQLVRDTSGNRGGGGQVQIDGAQVIRGLLDALGN